MTVKRTAAHWGSYLVETDGAGVPLLRDEPDDPLPAEIGQGWVSAMRDKDLRIGRPAFRRGWLAGDGGRGRGEDTYVEVPWDEALDRVAGELQRVQSEFGPASIFAGSYGWASAGRFHHAQSQLGRFVNLLEGYTGARDTYSHACAEVILPYIVGFPHRQFSQQMTTWPRIAEHCKLLVAFGGISGRTAQISSGGTTSHETEAWLARGAANGMRIVNVSPRASDMNGELGAEWLSIRPGTDVALMLALAHTVLVSGQADLGFLERYTSGWPEFRDYLLGKTDGQPKSAAWAAPICDIAADRMMALAEAMAVMPTMISVNWALQRAHHGEHTIWAGLALACMLGQIGKPGCGFGFGYGSSAHIGRPVRTVPWPAFPQGEKKEVGFIPVARIADMLLSPGGSYTYKGETRTYPDTRLVYWAGGNPFHHHQDLNRLETAWRKPETIVVHDHSWTATARRADIVLPATSGLEREDMMINSRDRTMIFMSAVMQPFGEARDDHAIFAGLAERLGKGAAYTQGMDKQDWLRWLWEKSREVGTSNGIALPDFESFRAVGRIDLPEIEQDRDSLSAFIADPSARPLRTETGKITLFNRTIAAMELGDCPGHPAWMEPREWLGMARPDQLHLLSGQPATRLHGQLDNGSASRATKSQGREPCTLHPSTARRIGAKAGDIVRIFNARGACLAALKVSDAMREDCVWLATGAWYDPQMVDGHRLEVHGNPNAVTLDMGASGLSQGNVAHTTLVEVEVWRGPLPELKTRTNPVETTL